MLAIRFARIGKNKQPYYRLIINQKSQDTFGDFIENLGSYDPRSKKASLKAERIKHWLAQGAQASPSVYNLLIKEKVIDGPKIKAWTPKRKEKGSDDVNKADTAVNKVNNAEIKQGDETQSAETAPKAEEKTENIDSNAPAES